MAEINRAEATAEVLNWVQSWAQIKGVTLPDIQHLLKNDEVRRAMSSLKIAILARQEGIANSSILAYRIVEIKQGLGRALSAHYGILLPSVEEGELVVDPDLLEDEEPWYEDPGIIWGGFPDIGLTY